MDSVKEHLEEGQIVLCTVEKIVGTIVFVKIEDNGEGTITTSEISPGRIRNLRDYVVPGKKIVCKILRIRQDNIHLSLRRVKPSERKELLDQIKKDRSYYAILNTVVGKEKAKDIKDKITKDYTLSEFFDAIKTDNKLMERYIDKSVSEKIQKILDSKKEKLKSVKQIFRLSNRSNEGINIIREILTNSCKGSKCRINYLAAGKYSLTLIGENFKELKSENNQVLDTIEENAKANDCEFSLEKS